MLGDVNEYHARSRPDDADLRARSASFAVARGMMRAAPEALDVAAESARTLASYGISGGDTSLVRPPMPRRASADRAGHPGRRIDRYRIEQ